MREIEVVHGFGGWTKACGAEAHSAVESQLPVWGRGGWATGNAAGSEKGCAGVVLVAAAKRLLLVAFDCAGCEPRPTMKADLWWRWSTLWWSMAGVWWSAMKDGLL